MYDFIFYVIQGSKDYSDDNKIVGIYNDKHNAVEYIIQHYNDGYNYFIDNRYYAKENKVNMEVK